MPQPFNNAVITNSGARLLTRAQAGEIKIEFTRIAVGNGEYEEDEKTLSALQIQTDLKSSKNSYPISDLEVYSDYSVKVTALITNLDPVTGGTLVNAGYFINEMGLFAREKDGEPDTEVLYSIAVTTGDYGDFMPPYNGYNPAQIIQEYFATVNNSSEVYIKIEGAVALAEDVMSIRQDVERLKQNGVAGEYSADVQYHAGEYCIHESILYKCLQDTTGEWNPECWQKTSPMEEVESLKKEINGQISMLESLSKILGTDQDGKTDWIMQGATESSAGKSGMVPAPDKEKQDEYLKGDATWENMDEHKADFTAADSRSNISPGDKIKTIFGKIAKVFSDMGTAAYYALANNLATTEPGFAMDARVGPVIDGRLVGLEDRVSELNSALETDFINTYTYVLQTDANSFFNAIVGSSVSNTTGNTLDSLHKNIDNHNTGIFNFNSSPYFIILLKNNNKNYCGILICSYMKEVGAYGLPVYFSYVDNGHSLSYTVFAPRKITV